MLRMDDSTPSDDDDAGGGLRADGERDCGCCLNRSGERSSSSLMELLVSALVERFCVAADLGCIRALSCAAADLKRDVRPAGTVGVPLLPSSERSRREENSSAIDVER